MARWTQARFKSLVWRDPYVDTASFQIGPGGPIVNGEASLIYPGYAPQYGLTDPIAAPVASLRLESMRDGIEDVDLTTIYRARFGVAAARGAWGAVFGKVRTIPGSGLTWPEYSNIGLAERQERARRAMIDKLEIGLPSVPGVQPIVPPATKI